MRPFIEIQSLRKVATKFNSSFEYVDIDSDPSFQDKVEFFKRSHAVRTSTQKLREKRINASRKHAKSPDEEVKNIYEMEYALQEGRSGYGFLNALLTEEGFQKVTGLEPNQFNKLVFLDVGTGSGELVEFLSSTGVPKEQLTGTDVAQASVEILRRIGVRGYEGRLEDLPIAPNSIDVLLLSYFVDYDANQKATFNRSLDLVRQGGKIIFEGLLPCLMDMSNINPAGQITIGRSLAQDTEIICRTLIDIGNAKGKELHIERIVLSHRYISSRYGLTKRRSVFIVASVT